MRAGRAGRSRIWALNVLLGFCAADLCPSLCWAEDSSPPAAGEAAGMTFDCAGRTSETRSLPPFASGGEAKFEVSVAFGEGAIIALVDPETSAIREPLYDAESTSGHVRFDDGEETTIVWTRMSGVDGALIGEAVMSDGNVLAISIERAPDGAASRPFVLFAAGSASLLRGTCTAMRAR